MSWTDALRYATSPVGAGMLAGLVLSWIADYIPAFTYLDPKAKRVVFLAACLLVPVLASLLSAAMGMVELTWDPLVWDALMAGVTAFGAGTMLNSRALPSRAERDAFDVFRSRCATRDVPVKES